MANTQDWTNFSGGCTMLGGGIAARCNTVFTFTNFIMGNNDAGMPAPCVALQDCLSFDHGIPTTAYKCPETICHSGSVITTSGLDCYGIVYQTAYFISLGAPAEHWWTTATASLSSAVNCTVFYNNHWQPSPETFKGCRGLGMRATFQGVISGTPIAGPACCIVTGITNPDNVTLFAAVYDTTVSPAIVRVLQFTNASLSDVSNAVELGTIIGDLVPGDVIDMFAQDSGNDGGVECGGPYLDITAGANNLHLYPFSAVDTAILAGTDVGIVVIGGVTGSMNWDTAYSVSGLGGLCA